MAAYYTFEDLSGSTTPNVSTSPSDNPYASLIESCHNDPVSTFHLIRLPVYYFQAY